MKYKVIHAEETREIEKQVSQLISEGWKPQSGLIFTPGIFYQALIRE